MIALWLICNDLVKPQKLYDHENSQIHFVLETL